MRGVVTTLSLSLACTLSLSLALCLLLSLSLTVSVCGKFMRPRRNHVECMLITAA